MHIIFLKALLEGTIHLFEIHIKEIFFMTIVLYNIYELHTKFFIKIILAKIYRLIFIFSIGLV